MTFDSTTASGSSTAASHFLLGQSCGSPELGATLEESYSGWRKLDSAAASNRYRAVSNQSGIPVEVCLFPLATPVEVGVSLKQRAKHVEIVRAKLGSLATILDQVLALHVDATPMRVVLRAREQRVAYPQWLSDATPDDQLRSLAMLDRVVECAHEDNLFHGDLKLARIGYDLILCQPTLDYLDTSCIVANETDTPSYQSDASQLCALFREVCAPLVLADGVFSGRTRAVVRSLVEMAQERDEDAQLEHWRDVLADWNPAPDGTSTESIPHRELDSCGTEAVSICQDVERTNPFDADAAPTHPETLPQIGEQLGRFRLENVLGRGGMGMVFKAVDTTTDQYVAVKVLLSKSGNITQAIRRFRKEARLLEEVQNEHVTKFLGLGTERNFHYLAMEFIDGTDLKKWFRARGPIGETLALELIADIAKALADPHRRQVVHRDIKPENVLLEFPDHESERPRVKLSDFGIARYVNQSESMELTKAGTLLGTPSYMSPEQCKQATHIGPAADVYSLGVLLYELLSGQCPYVASNPMHLVAKHCFDPIPNIQHQRQEVSDATADLLRRMLAKDPADRFADAKQLLTAIRRLVRGEATSQFAEHPRIPEHRPTQIWQKTLEWELKSTPDELWPFVSNTDRLNKAMGLPAVQYRFEKDPVRGQRRLATVKLGPVKMTWEEHPFEWIEGARFGVLREFDKGPFKWFHNTVELLPSDTGTRLVQTLRIEPRNTLGRVMASVEAGWKAAKGLDRVYRRIDATLQRSRVQATSQDHFESFQGLSHYGERRIQARLQESLVQGADPDALEVISDLVRNAPVQTVSKIRPRELARSAGLDADVMLDACLIAASQGILELKWDVLCPTCRTAAASADLLSQIKAHTECEACDSAFQSDAGNAIEAVFRVHRELRKVENKLYCAGGPQHAPHVVSQVRVAAGETVDLDVRLSAGAYLLRANHLAGNQPVTVHPNEGRARVELALGDLRARCHEARVPAGRVVLTLTNNTACQQTVRLERSSSRSDAITAVAISTNPKFRALFPEQAFRQEMPVAAEDLTLLAARIGGIDALHGLMDEGSVYGHTQALLDAIEQVVAGQGGAVVKRMGETVMAAFEDPTDAIGSLVALLSNPHNSTLELPVHMNFALHRGKALVTTQNGVLDYFGATVRKVLRMVDEAQGQALVSDTLFADPASHDALQLASGDWQLESLRFPDGSEHMIYISSSDVAPGC